MLEKQNAVGEKTAAGDAADLDDIIDAGADKLGKLANRKATHVPSGLPANASMPR